MPSNVEFGLSVAVALFFWFPWFLSNRSPLPPMRLMRVHRALIALDVSYSYELFGNGSRRGVRSILISQRVFRLLVKKDKEILWNCHPVRFVK